MIEDLYFSGAYSDGALKIEATLVNPADYGFSEDVLLFLLQIYGDADADSFTFYIGGKQDCLYNAESVTHLKKDGLGISIIVSYLFRPEFLYSQVRLGFLYEPHGKVEFIKIKH